MAGFAQQFLSGMKSGITGVPTQQREEEYRQLQQKTQLGESQQETEQLRQAELLQKLSSATGAKSLAQMKAHAQQYSAAFQAMQSGGPQAGMQALQGFRDTLVQYKQPTTGVDEVMSTLQADPEQGMGMIKSIANAFQTAGFAEGAKGPDIGQYNPRDYTTDSFNQFTKTGDPSVLVKEQTRLTPEQEFLVSQAKTKGKEETEDVVKLRSETLRQGLAAKTMVPKLEKLIELNELISSGKTAPARKLMANLFNLKGEDSANLGLFDAQSKQMVLSMIKQLGANPTEGERGFLMQITPSIEQGTTINAAILNDLLDVQKRQYERGLKLRKNPSADPYELLYDDDWTPSYTGSAGGKSNASQSAPQAAIDMLIKNPSMKGAFQQKYGYLPEGM